MKKIVLASAAMGGAALLAFGASGTFAAFSDRTDRVTERAESGTLFLETGEFVQSSAFDAGNLAPGQSVTYVTYLENPGTLAGRLTAVIELSDDAELPGCNANEAAVDTTCGTGGISDGELAEAAEIDVYYGVTSEDDCDAGARPGGALQDRNVRAINGGQVFANQPISAEQGYCAVYVVSIPSTVGNEIQSDSLQFRIKYLLDQAI